jgi:competence protein ComEA
LKLTSAQFVRCFQLLEIPMFKKLLAALACLACSICMAAVDVNKGSVAELDAVKGIGPALSKQLVEERNKAPFKDWNDLMTRVTGIKEKRAHKLSAAGLTVSGEPYAIYKDTSATKPAHPARKNTSN